MAAMMAGPRPPAEGEGGGNTWLLPFMLALFFAWGLATVLVDIVTPKLKSLFELSYTEATLTQFCFFAAYALVSLPAGAMVARIGYMRGLVIGLVVMAAGCLLFAPAARVGLFPMFLLALFVMASGIAVLQVAANPLVARLGDPAQASSRLTLAQTFNSLGTTVGPIIGAWTILAHTVAPSGTDAAALAAARQAEADVVRTPFLVIAAGLCALAILFWFLRRRVREEQAAASSTGGLGLDLLRGPRLALGALAIFLYVGAEVAIGTLMVSYLELPRVLAASPEMAGHLLSFYWGGAFAGRIVGSFVLRFVRPGVALCACALAAAGLTALSGLTAGALAGWALIAVGLANAIQFPTIFAMAIEGLGERTAQGAGIVCVAIVGGAIVPVAAGALADGFGLTVALVAPAVCYLCIAAYALAHARDAFGRPADAPAPLAAE